MVSSGKELKNVDTGEFIALKDGRILPIHVRIEEGAIFPVDDTGGTVSSANGNALLEIPAGALPSATGIAVRPHTGGPAELGFIPGTAFDFGPDGASANGHSFTPELAGDGRAVAFLSNATNLVAAGTTGLVHTFVFDRMMDRTTLISYGPAGEADARSEHPSISLDGAVVAFGSQATNLFGDDLNTASDIFVRDRFAGTLWRASVDEAGVEGAGASFLPSLSNGGNLVVFSSEAALVADDGNGSRDIYLRDAEGATTERVSVRSDGSELPHSSTRPRITAGGDFVVFDATTDDLVAEDGNGFGDVFLRSVDDGSVTLVSRADSGAAANGNSSWGSASDDGRFVAFTSMANNLVAGDSNGVQDVFVRDVVAGRTGRVSVRATGAEANAASFSPRISNDGRFVSFHSTADNLVPGDSNGVEDVFVTENPLMPAGHLLRSVVYEEGQPVQARDVAVDSEGNTWVTGQVHNGVDWAIFVAMVDSIGALRWTRSFSGSASDFGWGIAIDTAGNGIVTGRITNGNTDVFLAKLDAEGQDIWVRSWDGGSHDEGRAVAVDGWDNIAVAGFSVVSDPDVLFMSFDPQGNERWSHRLQSAGYDIAHAVAADRPGNVYLAAGLDLLGTPRMFVGWGASFGFSRMKHFSSSLPSEGLGIAVDVYSNPIVTGYVHNGSDKDIWVAKLDRLSLEPMWEQAFDGGRDDFGYAATVDRFGDVLVAGQFIRGGSDHDAWVARLGPSGQVRWSRTIDPGLDDAAQGVALDPMGNLTLAGYSFQEAGFAFWLGKLKL